MPKYKLGDIIITKYNNRLLVTKGRCRNCFFSAYTRNGAPYCALSIIDFKEGCYGSFGDNLIVVQIKKGGL